MPAEKGERAVPRLRFPEFAGGDAWEVRPFGDLFQIGSGKDYKHLGSGDIPVYGSGGLMLKVDGYLYDGESACIGRKGTIDKPMFLKGKFWTVDTLFYTYGFKNCSPRFVYLLFQTVDWLKHNEAGGVPSLSKTNIEQIRVAVPKLPEQQKVADFLFSVDEMIAAETERLRALSARKRGLLQQLFPGEEELSPRLRFPEFRNFAPWEYRRAGALFWNRIEPGHAELPIYSVTTGNGMVRRSSLDREVDDLAVPEGNKRARKDDIAYNMMRMWQGASGVAPEECMVSPAYVVLAPQADVCSAFYACLFKLPKYLHLLTSHSQGLTSDRLRLYYKDFARIPLPQPPLGEQQMIADCVSTMEELVAAQSARVDALKAHRKSLLQLMLVRRAEDFA